ncbi:hypothetical protein E8E12_008852 [Didymella heteroderae]|uniref:Methyltransferase domain-containing protein n=1 Tax=Didymella heteroderae TaxID=1769908 RepID=A0A9P5C0R2_9PLEO|nr:hypothetical protein E8E12_008852 [Didymella heteroderae]
MTSSSDAVKAAWQQTTDVAQRYKMAENATRPFAKTMVQLTEQLTTIKTTPVDIFDLGCGTGAVEAEIYASVNRADWDDLRILAGDVSPGMLEYLAKRGAEEGWSKLVTKIVDGAKLADADVGAAFAHIFVGFAVFVLPPGTVRQLAQRLAEGGTLALSTWAYLPWFRLLEKTLAKIEDGPDRPTEDQLWKMMTNGQPWQDAKFVRQQLEEAGLQKVEIVQKKENVDCGTPEVFMTTFKFVLGMLSVQWSEEKRAKWLEEVGDTMTAILVEEVGGPDKHVFMEFEGIVGVGLKE